MGEACALNSELWAGRLIRRPYGRDSGDAVREIFEHPFNPAPAEGAAVMAGAKEKAEVLTKSHIGRSA